jgi:rRNA maturation RNase YbeY
MAGSDLIVEVTVDWAHPDTAEQVTEESLARLLRHALELEARTGVWTFALRFVGDQEMSTLHQRYLNDPSPTDIMTFPYDEDDAGQGGDILISVDTATENAAEHRWPIRSELEFLVLHGLLHVLGWDDETPTLRAAMLDRQHAILAGWSEGRARWE